MESDHCDRCGTFHKGWIPYDNSVDTLLIKLGFSCDIRAAFAEETISLECIADLEPGDFKEAGVKIGDRPMLKQAAAREFASMQGRAPTTTNQPVDPTDNEAATPASTPLSARGPAASIIRADPTEQPASKRPRVTTALPNRCASFEEAMLLATSARSGAVFKYNHHDDTPVSLECVISTVSFKFEKTNLTYAIDSHDFRVVKDALASCNQLGRVVGINPSTPDMQQRHVVEAVCGRRINGHTGDVEYSLKWKDSEELSWEKEANCSCRVLIREFDASLRE